MTDRHPMDDVPFLTSDDIPAGHVWERRNFFSMSEELRRAERIAAYELGRNAGLEEAAEQHEIEVQLSGLLEATSRACAEKDLALQACIEALEYHTEQTRPIYKTEQAIQQAQEALK